MTETMSRPSRRSRTYYPTDSRRAGAAWYDFAADSEPLERFESPRPQERVLPASPPRSDLVLPTRARPVFVEVIGSLPPPPPKRVITPQEASVGVRRTHLAPTRQQLHLAAFRPQLAGPQRSICAQRSDRRSILFASGKAGFGKRKSPGPYNRTTTSNYGCRR